MMRWICLVLVLSSTTSADAWAHPGVAWAQPLRAHASTTLTVRQAASCNLKTTRVLPVRGEDGRHGDAMTNASCDNNASRRGFLRRVTAALGAAAATESALPRASVAGEGTSAADVKKGIEADFLSRRYYVTGELTPSLYRPDCLFTDPTTRVASVDRYTAAVKLLFDPDNSQVDLLSLEIKDDKHIFAEWRLQGYLKFPWHPYVKPYTGTTLYTLDSEGFITRHEETWSITALDAARATITPTAGPQAVL